MPEHLTRSRATLEWIHKTTTSTPRSAKIVEARPPSGTLLAVGEVLEVLWPYVDQETLRGEAQVLAAFRHGGLATAYALGHHQGRPFLVMELIGGASLSEHLRHGRLSIAESIDLLIAICDTLSVLHQAGLAHSDLKPSNIMLAPHDRLVLLDFGIVRVEQLRREEHTVSGSPHYMAPEAIRGKVRPGEGHLVDLYAVGVIGFVLLTGRAPYDHDDPVELMIMHLQRPIPDARSLRAEVPAELAALLSTLMAKQPEDRPPRIDSVRDDLVRLRARLTERAGGERA